MNVEWTNMAGFGPLAWNHGGPPVAILMRPPRGTETKRGVRPLNQARGSGSGGASNRNDVPIREEFSNDSRHVADVGRVDFSG